MRLPLACLGLLALSACATSVPDSGSGVGFQDYGDYASQREAQLRGTATQQGGVPAATIPGSTVPFSGTLPPANTTGFSADRIGAAIDAAAGPVAPVQPAITPLTPGAPGQVIGAPIATTPAPLAAQDAPAGAVAQPLQVATAQPAPSQQPAPSAAGSTNIVQFAVSTTHAPGVQMYKRAALQVANPNAACAKYTSSDLAQQAFLESGGPTGDRKGLDPDGDGYACGWDPRPFRSGLN